MTDNALATRFHRRLLHPVRTWFRRDGLVFPLYGLATIIMTYPLIFKLGQDWLGSYDVDTYVKLWDIYWFSDLLLKGQSPFFTTQLFYPTGLDLSFHSISWTTTGLTWLLKPFLGTIDAYNVTILLAVFVTAYAGYLYIRSLAACRKSTENE